jgi:hypothetical protein
MIHILSHLEIQETMEIKVIENSFTKYITFDMNKFNFVDSLSHLSGSLDSFGKSLKMSSMIHFISQFTHFSDEQMILVSQNEYIQYSYIDSFEILSYSFQPNNR